MALICCTDCGREISDKAAACIHCGCPLSRSISTEVREGFRENTNFTSKSSEYGNTYKGDQIYYFACQASNAHMHVGKKNIEQKLLNMSRDEINYNTFYFNDRPSRLRSSWITARRFKEIYESKLQRNV